MAIDDLISMQVSFPPDVVEDLAQLEESPNRLAIQGKTRNLGLLAEFSSLEALWIGNVNQRQFDQILPHIRPSFLLFNGLRAGDLSPLGSMSQLRALEIRWNTKVTDISFLTELTELRLLALHHCSKVHDLEPIASLTNLEILELSGGMWSTFKPHTLKPLSHLHKLRGLSLKAIRVGDESLAPVAGLKQLQELELSNQFPTEEYARLSVALPHIECSHFSPFLDFLAGPLAKHVMVTGKGKPVLSLPEDAERLERYVRRFREMQDRFKKQLAGEGD